MATVQELKERIIHLIKNKIDFTVDSNVLIDLAKGDAVFLMNTLLPATNFYLTPVIADKEILGLNQDQRFDKKIRDLLLKIRDYVIKNNKVKAGDPQLVQQHELLLRAQVVLIPRKIAHDLLIENPDSYLNKVTGAFNHVNSLLDQGQSYEDIITILSAHTKELIDFQKTLGEKATGLLKQKAQILDIELEDFDYDAYVRIINNIAKREVFDPINQLSEPLKDTAKIPNLAVRVASFKAAVENIISELSELKKKKHDADVKHIAHVLALDIENVSSDSDQIYLIELHARRRAA